ncbi:MAG TPA: type II secretion system protein [Candidatus Polarisedimenticolaceae bacterium]|nr:type II secretion system protein [Candidatus Polarisedimenticolaceae bacterium]
MSAKRSREAGYTLLELLIVCAMIGVIMNIAIPGLYEGMYRAKASRIIEDYNMVRTMVHQHYADHSFYPPDTGPGVEPPELSPYIQNRLQWTHEDYQYDWELWVDGSGNPTEPATGVIVGFSIVTSDPKLAAAVHRIYRGIILDTIPNHTTFVIEPYHS